MRKNILILSHGYGLPFIESCNQYTQLFDETTSQVTVAYLSGQPNADIRQKTLASNVLFLNCPTAHLRGFKLPAIYQVYKLCRDHHFDMVICHRYKPLYILLCFMPFLAIPLVIGVLHAMGAMQSFWRQLLFKIFAKQNIILAGVSNAVRDDLRRCLPSLATDRIITLNNIIDYPCFEPQLLSRTAARTQLGLLTEAFVFGHIGRLAPEKDQKSLILAFARIAAQQPHTQLVIIGQGALEAELKKQVRDLNLDSRILFTGEMANAYRFMKAFDTFILCSVKESFGRVLLEAMMARVPTIATLAGGMPEVIAESGMLVAAQHPEQLADAMRRACQSTQQELSQMGEKGYHRMYSHFSLEAVKKTFWQLPALQELFHES